MTALEQINALARLGCEQAVQVIARSNTPLSFEQLQLFLNMAIDDGSVIRAIGLAEIIGQPLDESDLNRLITRCIDLGRDIDALHAARQGPISIEVRRNLISALVNHEHAENSQEAERLILERD